MNKVFFLHLPLNKDLLQAEIENRPGDWRKSFSAPGLSTYLLDDRAFQNLKKVPIVFCLDYGFDLEKTEQLEVSVTVENDELIFKHDQYFCYQDPKGNRWTGELPQFKRLFQLGQIVKPSEAPSRAYLKIAQAFALFSYDRIGTTLEIGSAPGGASYFLLEQGLVVMGVDPGEMHASVLAHQNFTHLKQSIQSLEKSHLTHDFSCYVVDTNLSAAQSMKENIRVLSLLDKLPSELFITLKTPNTAQVRKLEAYSSPLKRLGYSSQFQQLPSHHREILLYAKQTRFR